VPSDPRTAFEAESRAAAMALASQDLDRAFHHLERAHIVGQRFLLAHLVTHVRMARVAMLRSDRIELAGQVVRFVAALLGWVVGWLPVGNTGGSNVPGLRPMPIPEDLRPYFVGYRLWPGVVLRAALAIGVGWFVASG